TRRGLPEAVQVQCACLIPKTICRHRVDYHRRRRVDGRASLSCTFWIVTSAAGKQPGRWAGPAQARKPRAPWRQPPQISREITAYQPSPKARSPLPHPIEAIEKLGQLGLADLLHSADQLVRSKT